MLSCSRRRLIQNAGMGKNMMDKFHIIGKHYVFSLSEMVSQLYSEMFTFLSHLYKEVGEKLSEAVLQSFLSLMLQGVSELCPEQAKLKETPGSRHFHQYRIFVRMVHEEYAREHQVVYYAKKMNMQPSALCRLVKKESGTYGNGDYQQDTHHGCQDATAHENTQVKVLR